MDLEMKIEAVLFYKTEPMKKSALAELFSVPIEEIEIALIRLTERLQGHGLQITTTDTSAQLVTSSSMSDLIDMVRKDEVRGEIGKAGAETLSIILYRGPLSRIELDRIRGVNSSFILRNLLIRGLIERRPHPSDSRSYVYASTPELLNHIGISKREELPDFERILNELDTFEKEVSSSAIAESEISS
ncbi:MAG: SMC-Scp complex subunit ScpB [Candidatus Pacebacteria bacterium]|nr:SMC-Scp complex subunit ScpB [Candidatus Paceibacterota bacterium]MCF7857099.1 SMC-Scp complex subunit ScpB [Candidatus Paceibacterota bacterium]